MDLTLIYTIVGFSLAAYSVIANDSVQTLGTFIASNQRFQMVLVSNCSFCCPDLHSNLWMEC